MNGKGQGFGVSSSWERHASEGQSQFRQLGYILRSSLAYIAALILCVGSAQLTAQTAYFSGVISTIGGGFSLPGSVAIDSNGNVYVADTFNSVIKEVLAAGGYTNIITLGSGFNYPSGVAVDAAGNVFVADTHNNAVKEMLAVNGAIPAAPTIVVLGGGFSGPLRVAVDKNDNVYVADDGNNAVKEIVASSGYSVVQTLGSGFNQPSGVAVDSSGNVYVADYGTSSVKEILAQGGYTTVEILGSGFNDPDGVGVDPYGNVYVGDTHNNAVKEMIAVNGVVPTSPVIESLGGGYDLPTDVVADASGHVFVSDRNNNAVKEIITGGVNFGSVAMPGATPTVIGLQFTFASASTIGAPSVVTQGAAHVDFIDAGTGSCSTNGTGYTYNPGDSCVVNVAFQPQLSGTRYGSVQLLNSSGAMLATAFVYGTGTGPQLIFSPPAQQAAGSTINASGIAVDGNGNIFVADSQSHTVSEVLAAGGYATTQPLPGAYDTPAGIAVDGGGNVYVADSGKGAVDEILAAGGYITVNQLATGFSGPLGVAVDASGNVYVADTGNNAIREIVAVTGTIPPSPVILTLGSGFQAPAGVAVDASGNVYVADTGNNAIKEIAAVNGVVPASPTITTLGSGFDQPAGLSLDGNNNIFVADTGNNAIRELLAAGGYTTANTLGSAFVSPSGVAVDGSDNVYIANTGKDQVLKLNYAQPPALTFAATPVGATSSDSPQTVTLINDGNQSLTFAVPPGGNNPAISSSFTIDGASTCPQLTSSSSPASLAASASCTDLINFTPATGGPITGTLVTTDNNLNLSGSMQTVSLNGTGSSITVGPSSLTSAQVAVAYGPVSLTASGGTAPYSFNVTAGALPPGILLSSGGVLSGTPTGAGSYNFTVTATDSSSYTGVQPYTLMVAPPVLKLSPATIPAGQTSTAYTQTFTAAGGTAPYTFQVTGGALPAGLSLSSAGVLSGTPTDAGNFSITVTATDSSSGTGAPFSVSGTYTLSIKGPGISLAPGALAAGQVGQPYTPVTITASGGTAPYTYSVTKGAVPPGLSLSAAGSLSGTPTAAGSYSFTVTATDADSFTGTQTYSLAIEAAIGLSPASLPAGTAGVAYGPELFSATGGAAPYSYKLAAGSLPAGLTLTSAGLLSGTPGVAGSFSITVQATDANGFNGSQAYTLVVNAPTITITPSALPTGQAGAPYGPEPLEASGGTAPYTFRLTAGSLPGGITLSAGTLSGTPAAAGSSSFTVQATDANGFTGTHAYTLAISASAITVTPASLAAAQVNVPYSQTIAASGGTPPYTFSETGTVPAGITFSSGVFTGTPTAAGSFPLTITVTDSASAHVSVSYNLTVRAGTATLSFAAIPPQTYGNAPFAVSASSSSPAAVTYSVVSGPATVNASTGQVTLTGAGTLVLEASQAATSAFGSSTAQTTLAVARQASVVNVSASSTSISPGQSVTFTATVKPYVLGTPGGSVTFFDGTAQLGSPVALTNGTAQYVDAGLASGQHQITAVYSGDSNFLEGSGTLGADILVGALGLTLTATGQTVQAVTPGSSAIFAFTLAPAYSVYPGTVTFSVSGLPAGASYTITPSSVASNAGPQSVTLTVQTSTTTARSAAPVAGSRYAPLLLALLLPFAGLRRLRHSGRKLSRMLGIVILLAAGSLAVMQLTGCGVSTVHAGQKYSVTVTAASGSVQQSAGVTLEVQ